MQASNEKTRFEAEKDSLTQFESNAIRAPKSGAYEQALGYYLFTTLKSSPLEKVRKTGEICAMLKDEHLKNLPYPAGKIGAIHRVASTLLSPEIKSDGLEGRAYSINWGFVLDEEWDIYLGGWAPEKLQLGYYPDLGAPKSSDKRKRFIELCGIGLTEKSFRSLSTRFEGYAVPLAMKTLSYISTLIQPDALERVIKTEGLKKGEPVE